MDEQADVFEARPAAPDIDAALLRAVDALAFPAVLALNEAHGVLVNASVVTKSPPSDQWYHLIEQLTAPRRVVGAGVTFPRTGMDDVDRTKQEHRLYVGAAAFLAAEAHHLEDHCQLEDHWAAFSGDAGLASVLDRLSDIADQVRDAADALLRHAEILAEPLPAVSRTDVARGGQSAHPWFHTVALAAVYGVLGHFIIAFPYRTLVIVLLFVIGPSVAVLRWHLQARHPHYSLGFLRTPRRAAEWPDEIRRQSGIMDTRAAALHDLLRRVDLVVGDVAAERQVCEYHGLLTAVSKLDSLGRLLHDASESAGNLAELVAESSAEARMFTASCQRDPREACAEDCRLPLLLDPERIRAAMDSLVLALCLAGEVAVDIPLHIQGKCSPLPVGKISAAVESMFREVQESSRSLKHECRGMLRAFDSLHRLVTTESIAALPLGLASRTTARAAVAVTVLVRPRARRPAVRTAFVREAPASSSRSCVWIGKATAAAITRGQKSLV